MEHRERYENCIECGALLIDKAPSPDDVVKQTEEEAKKPTSPQSIAKAKSDEVQGEIIVWSFVVIFAAIFPEWSFSLKPTQLGVLMGISIPFSVIRLAIEWAFIAGAVKTLIQPHAQHKLWAKGYMPLEIQRTLIGVVCLELFYLMFGPMLRIFVVIFISRLIHDMIIFPKHIDYYQSDVYEEGLLKRSLGRIYVVTILLYFGIHHALFWISLYRTMNQVCSI